MKDKLKAIALVAAFCNVGMCIIVVLKGYTLPDVKSILLFLNASIAAAGLFVFLKK